MAVKRQDQRGKAARQLVPLVRRLPFFGLLFFYFQYLLHFYCISIAFVFFIPYGVETD